MANELKTLSVADVPVGAIEALREHAVDNGYNKNDASVARFAIVELAKRIELEKPNPAKLVG